MERTIRRGDIFMADLNPIIGSEQGGIRPVLILSNNLGNTGVSPQLTVCQSRPHRLRRFYHARTVTGREYHYALCGSQRNRELPGILSR